MSTALPGRLTAATRRRSLDELAAARFDVIVVGGGITGAGVALDAASRGMRTALVERVDLAAGTSRWSSKLVHGGLRYLAHGELSIAWESARERHALLTAVAPHLVRPIATVLPLDDALPPVPGLVSETGVRVADLLRVLARTPRRLLPPPRRISAQDTLLHLPALREDGLRGGILYFDTQVVDDARLVAAVARTAAAHGAHVVTRCAASDLAEDSVLLTDELTGQSFTAHGAVVNATGVWVGDHEPRIEVTASRGSHLVVPGAALGHPRGVMTVPVPGALGRYVLAIPQPDGLVYIGLTDEPAPGADGIAPPVPAADERFLLEVINRGLRTPLRPADVVGRYAGLRPLVTGAGAATTRAGTADISRRHLLVDEPGRPVTIAGGKLTTYRQMAQDAVDAVARRTGCAAACRTRRLPLIGAASPTTLASIAAPEHLVRRYGTEAQALAALMERHPDLAEPVVPGRATVGAELAWGVLAEGALDPRDLVERRTRLALVDADAEPATRAAEAILERFAGAGESALEAR